MKCPAATWASKMRRARAWAGSPRVAPGWALAGRPAPPRCHSHKEEFMSLNLRSLISKLNDSTRLAMEAAAGFCLSRTHYDVEIEHYLMKLLDARDTDLAFINRHFGVDPSRLAAELTRSIDGLK